ncbi:MAG TPA: acyl carrier protein [Planctomycetaceae bacterium]|nr:acyl carrier protein [Planctomycetaceae bacterium]
MTDPATITAELTAYLTEASCSDTPLMADTDLLATGLVDSLMMTDLVHHVESRYGVRLDAEDLRPKNFRTPRVLAELVAQKSRLAAPAPR